MVTFSRIPYAEALSRGRLQDQLLMKACAGVKHVSEINLAEMMTRMEKIDENEK